MQLRSLAQRVIAAYTAPPTITVDWFEISEAGPPPPDDYQPPEPGPRPPRPCPVCYHEELYGPLHWLDHIAVCAAAKAERLREANRAAWQRRKQVIAGKAA